MMEWKRNSLLTSKCSHIYETLLMEESDAVDDTAYAQGNV